MRIMRKEARKGKKEREKGVRWGTKGIEGECVKGGLRGEARQSRVDSKYDNKMLAMRARQEKEITLCGKQGGT